jgi:hypothetical protein
MLFLDENGYRHDPLPGTPAYRRWWDDGSLREVRFYQHGQIHDPLPGTPAVSIRRQDGTLVRVEYYDHGQLHRRDAPAVIEYNGDLLPQLEEWWTHGRISRCHHSRRSDP